jgi:hypothetical protein
MNTTEWNDTPTVEPMTTWHNPTPDEQAVEIKLAVSVTKTFLTEEDRRKTLTFRGEASCLGPW